MSEILKQLTDELNNRVELRPEAKQVQSIAEAAKDVRGSISPETVFKAMVQAVFGKMNWD